MKNKSNSVSGLTAQRSHRLFIAGLIALAVTSCRMDSDNVMNYAYNDNMAFGDASRTFAGEFDVMWSGLSANYALWDFEYEQGLDWDRVYDIYRPKFAALDTMKTPVSDMQLKDLLESVIAPLHDGHMAVQLKNHSTGRFISSSPGRLRVMRERGAEYAAVQSKGLLLDYYNEAGELKQYINSSSATLLTVAVKAFGYIKGTAERLDSIPEAERTPAQQDTLALYTQIYQEIALALGGSLVGGDQNKAIEQYNYIAYKYMYLHIPYLEPIDAMINQMAINITYALFNDNIAYLAFDGFKLSAYLEPSYKNELFGKSNETTKALVDSIAGIWRAWFDAIQIHHNAGDLKGIIIDVRSNGGGMLNDYKYVLGALMPSGGFHDCDGRFKRGSGRLDYSPLVPQTMPTLDSAHVTVTEPVVVLCNCASVSMAEHTAYGAKLMENGTLIGTRTWGGFCALSGAQNYTYNYSGHVGVQNETPVYCYVPQEVAFTLDGKIVEGYGIEPDIEVAFDAPTWSGGAGPDSQLDRALQFIRTGN